MDHGVDDMQEGWVVVLSDGLVELHGMLDIQKVHLLRGIPDDKLGAGMIV